MPELRKDPISGGWVIIAVERGKRPTDFISPPVQRRKGGFCGLWCNYSQLQRDFKKLYYDGTIRTKLGADEFKGYAWAMYEKGAPSFLFELLPRLARREGELGMAMGLGTGGLLERWGLSEALWTKDHELQYWKLGHPKHHANEDAGQCGVILNTQYNRDAQCHSHANFTRNGLPLAVQKRIAAEVWGSPDAVDAVQAFTHMNVAKARMAKWSLLRKELHDSMSLCNWMGPWVASPLRERGYRGDDTIESLGFLANKPSCLSFDGRVARNLLNLSI